MDNRKIGEFITLTRKKKNMTQKELADILGVTDKAISKWERGAGYPDISILKPLAEALGVTVTELLDGEASTVSAPENVRDQQAEADKVEENNNRTLLNALSYTDHLIRQKENRIGNIIGISIGLMLFLAIFICMIVDLAVTKQFTWSLIVIDSCVFGGCLFIPPFVSKKHGLLYSLCFLTILIFPFLGILYRLTAPVWLTPDVLWKMEFPIALIWLLILWLSVLLIRRVKINPWFKLSILSLVCIPANLLTNGLVDRMFDHKFTYFDFMEYVITISVLVFIAVISIMIGMLRRGRSKKAWH
jgi:transcriptional regulator with XRE-family HTH domain